MNTTRPLRILALTHTAVSEGCTYVRMDMPLRALHAAGWIDYELLHLMPWNVGAIRQTLRTMHSWDLIWLSRPRHYFMLPLIRQARRLGKPVLIDLDDWLLEVPAGHVDADFYRTRPRRETIRTALRAADGVTASTQVIAKYCAALGVRVHVLPNAVDCTQFTRKPRTEGPLTIAFCGTPSHYDDVPLVASALRAVLQRQPDRSRVISVGCPIPGMEGLDNYIHFESVPATDYPKLLSSLLVDVGLAPLQDTAFNKAKSDIKYLEYSAVGAATIASPVAPYLASVRADRGLLAEVNTVQAWLQAIMRVVETPHLRQDLAERAYRWVHEERSIEATATKWLTLFQRYASTETLYAAPGLRQLDDAHFARVMANIVLRQSPSDGKQLQQLLAHKIRTTRRNRLSFG